MWQSWELHPDRLALSGRQDISSSYEQGERVKGTGFIHRWKASLQPSPQPSCWLQAGGSSHSTDHSVVQAFRKSPWSQEPEMPKTPVREKSPHWACNFHSSPSVHSTRSLWDCGVLSPPLPLCLPSRKHTSTPFYENRVSLRSSAQPLKYYF